jgi:methionyl aminopeptidase
MSIESEQDLKGLERIGRIVGLTLREMQKRVRAGMTTAELDHIGAQVLVKHGAQSAPQRLYGFPGVNCISLNDEAVHGIPGERVIQPGDLVKLDVTAELNGYIADAAVTVAVPPISPFKNKLRHCAVSAFDKAIAVARAGRPLNEIGRAVEGEVRRHGFTVMPELSGHGVGRAIHEDPSVPNFYDPQLKGRLTEGLVITIEPIISAGTWRSARGDDAWVIKTADGSLSAHYEHTVVITRGQPVLLTAI